MLRGRSAARKVTSNAHPPSPASIKGGRRATGTKRAPKEGEKRSRAVTKRGHRTSSSPETCNSATGKGAAARDSSPTLSPVPGPGDAPQAGMQTLACLGPELLANLLRLERAEQGRWVDRLHRSREQAGGLAIPEIAAVGERGGPRVCMEEASGGLGSS